MCCTIYIKDDPPIYNTGQLAALVGPENVLQFIGETGTTENANTADLNKHADSCMCWIAIEATLTRTGYVVDFDGMDYFAAKGTPDA
jgi:hypothetical protein